MEFALLTLVAVLVLVFIQRATLGVIKERSLPVRKDKPIPLYGARMQNVVITDTGLVFTNPMWGSNGIDRSLVFEVKPRFFLSPSIIVFYKVDGKVKREVIRTPVYKEATDYLRLLWKI